MEFNNPNLKINFKQVPVRFRETKRFSQLDLDLISMNQKEIEKYFMWASVGWWWMQEVKEHEWFKQTLPDYLFPSPYDQDASIIDTATVAEVCSKFRVSLSTFLCLTHFLIL